MLTRNTEDVIVVGAGGTTGDGEGNLLLSDKEPGPELELALLSAQLWRELADELPPEIEYESKGGLVVGLASRGGTAEPPLERRPFATPVLLAALAALDAPVVDEPRDPS